MASICKITPVPNRLGRLLRKPGGIAREQALQAAAENVETLREEFVAAIPGEIAALEAIFADEKHKSTAERLDAMLRRADQLLTLSGTYGFDRLDTVVKRFCDLASGMIDKTIEDSAPVRVHLRAMRLVCPGAPEISQSEADAILDGLVQLHAHYGITRGQDVQTD